MYNNPDPLYEKIQRSLAFAREENRDAVIGMLDPRLAACSAGDRMLRIRYRTQPWQRNGRGQVHGGITAAMFDQAMGTLVRALSTPEHRIMTAELSVSYLRPLIPGAQAEVYARVLSAGRTFIRLRGEMTDCRDGGLLAAANAVFVCKR